MNATIHTSGGRMRFHDEAWMNILATPVVFFGVSAIWVLAVFFLVHHMMNKPPVAVKGLMQIYNVVQIVVCAYMCWGLYPVVTLQNSFPYINLFGVNTEFDRSGEWFVFVHYLSKYLDWFDTLWIVLNKKRQQLSFLHIYHHGTIVPVWGMLLHAGVGSGTVRYGAFVNSITHVIMYTHYLWTSMGLRNPFKKYITMWQITQFYSCIVHAFVVLFFEKGDSNKFAWIQILYQITMVYLFSWKMSYVPDCVPNLCAEKGETPISCMEFCHSNPQDSDEAAEQTETRKPLSKQEKYRERYIVIRGDCYDITNFQHPGGLHMVDLGVGRDATIMFEFAHLRIEKAEALLKTLPKYTPDEIKNLGYDVGEGETWPTPSKSELYETLRKRVREEIVKPLGRDERGYSTVRGVPSWYYLPVIFTWLVTAFWFVTYPSIVSGICLGLSLCWVGTGIQHTANHGGLEKDTKVEYLLGLLNDIAVGGSSICWRYHHNVSHHAYCNDVLKDADTYSSFPLLRMDSSQKLSTYHRFQWLYGPVSFCFLWISIQIADLQKLLDGTCYDVSFNGTKSAEIVLNVLRKVIPFWWIVVLPYQYHGLEVMLYPWMACFGFGGFVLASMFIVSHNVDETKLLESPDIKSDWAKQQILTSTSWGCKLGCFLSGGLNLQIEHHLFPCLPHHLYPQVQMIVKDECKKRGIHYAAYHNLAGNWIDHIKFLYKMGQVDSKKTN
jgi:fatty acid desaturase (delta-4 desaturase)